MPYDFGKGRYMVQLLSLDPEIIESDSWKEENRLLAGRGKEEEYHILIFRTRPLGATDNLKPRQKSSLYNYFSEYKYIS